MFVLIKSCQNKTKWPMKPSLIKNPSIANSNRLKGSFEKSGNISLSVKEIQSINLLHLFKDILFFNFISSYYALENHSVS